jgi:RNA polymerase sigma-70 factor (ECF subfamily)
MSRERDSFTRQLSMIRANEPSDGELVRRMGAGDEEAFRVVYGRCQGPIFRFALHMSGSRTIAEDVTQEVFMFLLQENSRFDPSRGTLQSYLFGIGRNLVLRRVDREMSFVPLPEDEPHNGNGARSNGHRPSLVVPPVDLARMELIDQVRQAVLSLPVNYREVVILCDLQEKSYEEAAELLACAVGTVRSRLHRARALLTEKLRDLAPSESRPAAGPAGTGVRDVQ